MHTRYGRLQLIWRILAKYHVGVHFSVCAEFAATHRRYRSAMNRAYLWPFSDQFVNNSSPISGQFVINLEPFCDYQMCLTDVAVEFVEADDAVA